MWYATGVMFLSSLLLTGVVRGEVTLEKFAYAADIELDGAGAGYRLSMPEEVYAGVTRTDLGDLRVFNAAGVIVPHDLRLLPAYAEQFETAAELAFYPLEDEQRDLDRLRLSLTQGEAFTKLDIDVGGELESAVRGFIIDARDVAGPLHRLEVEWQAPSAGARFLAHVSVEASADLQTWRMVAADAVLADLSHLGHRLRRNRIDLPGGIHSFYRLKFKDTSSRLALKSLRGWSAKRRWTTRYRWRDVVVQPGQQAGEYRFTNLTGMHVYRIRVGLPERNTLAAATLQSRPNDSSSWVHRLTTSLYRLQFADGEINHPDLTVAGVTDQQWRLTVEQSGGGLGAGMPEVSMAWQPHDLVFIARGEAPFVLAWGSASVAPPTPSAASPFDRVGESAMRVARLHDAILHPGGASALVTPIDWRRYVLWGVLVLGALIIVVLALRLLHRMNKDGEPV